MCFYMGRDKKPSLRKSALEISPTEFILHDLKVKYVIFLMLKKNNNHAKTSKMYALVGSSVHLDQPVQ